MEELQWLSRGGETTTVIAENIVLNIYGLHFLVCAQKGGDARKRDLCDGGTRRALDSDLDGGEPSFECRLDERNIPVASERGVRGGGGGGWGGRGGVSVESRQLCAAPNARQPAR